MTRTRTRNLNLLPRLSTNRLRERANVMLQTQAQTKLMEGALEVIVADAVAVVANIQAMMMVRDCSLVLRSPILSRSTPKVYCQPQR